MADHFGAPWPALGYTVLVTVAMYVTTLLAVRVAGRRTVARISAFDVLVTVAIGTMLGSTALSRDPSYARGVVALVTLLSLQVAVAAARRRWDTVGRALDFRPLVVVRDGETRLGGGLLGPQLTPDELRSLLRKAGVFDGDRVALVVLEPMGGVSVRDAGSGADVAGSQT